MRDVQLNDVDRALRDSVSSVVRQTGQSRSRRLTRSEANSFRKDLSTLLTNAISWAGRAEVANRPEEALLQFVIALESLILHPDEKAELVYKLGVRVSHLLDDEPTVRRDMVREIKRLYDLRSKIVHNGDLDVFASDVGAARYLARTCITRLLLGDEYHCIRSADDLRTLLDNRVLGA